MTDPITGPTPIIPSSSGQLAVGDRVRIVITATVTEVAGHSFEIEGGRWFSRTDDSIAVSTGADTTTRDGVTHEIFTRGSTVLDTVCTCGWRFVSNNLAVAGAAAEQHRRMVSA